MVNLCGLILLAQAQLPPTYITKDSNGGLVVTQPGSKQPPIYVEPLPDAGDDQQRYQIVQPGTDTPPSYWIPREGGGVMVIRPGRDDPETPAK